MTTTSDARTWWQKLGTLPFTVAVLVACNALYIFLVAVGNITDYDTNFAFVQHVLSQDPEFPIELLLKTGDHRLSSPEHVETIRRLVVKE